MPILGIIASSTQQGLVTGSFESIATASGGSGTITFSSIPSTYTHLQIRILARNTNNSSEFGNIDIRFNNDSGANYGDHFLTGNGSTTTAGSNVTSRTLIGVTTNPCANLLTNTFGVAVIDILDYANTNKNKTTRALTGGDFNGSGSVNLMSGHWRSTSAINRIDLISYGGTTYNSNTRIALYGIKGPA